MFSHRDLAYLLALPVGGLAAFLAIGVTEGNVALLALPLGLCLPLAYQLLGSVGGTDRLSRTDRATVVAGLFAVPLAAFVPSPYGFVALLLVGIGVPQGYRVVTTRRGDEGV
ncbi:hypothetical protein [Halomarina ordinaria]|uniref:Phosphatidate cytidylyltransferase n=1 Tax=Halomarina ordinaria TaxID=3033939 RepID=A0ABD5U7I1_9EURY|nr:hypothetical protein [Halomarina sp. PSRA2]